jgi:Family of unknown function (DUF6498)
MSAAAADPTRPVGSADLTVRNALAVAANMLVLYGVLRWRWDPFQILIFYWCETGIVAFWALAKLYFLPPGTLGTITVNGRVRPATNRLLLETFAMVFGVFLAAHLGMLWIFFSAGSAAAVQGPVSFVREMVLASAAWLPLAFAFATGLLDFAGMPKRESIVLRIERRLLPGRSLVADAAGKPDGVGQAIAAPMIRIALMQVAVILGAIMVQKYGTEAPFFILIGLKTLVDIRRPRAATA